MLRCTLLRKITGNSRGSIGRDLPPIAKRPPHCYSGQTARGVQAEDDPELLFALLTVVAPYTAPAPRSW